MATVKNLFYIGIVFIFCSSIGESLSFESRRSLLDGGGPAIFNVKTFGALADDNTDNVLVSSFYFKFNYPLSAITFATMLVVFPSSLERLVSARSRAERIPDFQLKNNVFNFLYYILQAFRKAWMAACKNSTTPATLLFPEGVFRTSQTMFAGPCTSPSPITVEVIGTLKATTELSEYVSPDWITFLEVDGMVLKGRGVFDGQGAISWPLNDCKKNKGNCASLPDVSISFFFVSSDVVSIIIRNSRQLGFIDLGLTNNNIDNFLHMCAVYEIRQGK